MSRPKQKKENTPYHHKTKQHLWLFFGFGSFRVPNDRAFVAPSGKKNPPVDDESIVTRFKIPD